MRGFARAHHRMPHATDTHRATWRSPAKVNLCLRVVGRRADGYHLLDSIFVPLDLYDDVAIAVAGTRPGRATSVRVEADDPEVPCDESNLAARAARDLLAACGLGADVHVRLTKRIPAGAGLGGGSGNAATVLAGLRALLALDVTPAELAAVGLRLGADVPFFLQGRAARVRGIGEDVCPLADWPGLALVVAIPPVHVSTAWVFRAFREAVALDARPVEAPEPAALAAGAAPTPELLVNDLERIVLPAFPMVRALKERLRAAGATAAVMSGSGSAVVGVAPNPAAAAEIAATLGREDPALRVHAVAAPVG